MQAQATRSCAVLAYGDLKRVELAVALANQPRLLLMDEPTAGMAPRERGELMQLAANLARDSGIAVLFTEHDMDVVFAHADRIIVLAGGKLIAEGRPAEVRAIQGCARSISARAAPSARRQAVRMLEVRGLNAAYGQAHILFDLESRGTPGRGRGPARPQRRGQVHHPEIADRPGAAAVGRNPLRRQAHRPLAAVPDRPPRPGLRARRPAHLLRL